MTGPHLVKATGWDQSPAIYVIGASIVALLVLATTREPSRPNLDMAVAARNPLPQPASPPLQAR